MGLPFWDPRKILEYPPIYNFFQKAVGADKPRRRFFEAHIAPLGTARVLEVGCGPGTNCEWLPPDITYVGCDMNEEYIAYANRRYGDRAEFFATPVGKLAELGLKPFNAVIAIAVLHHIDDDEVATLCREVAALLEPGGMFITGDPCFLEGQSRWEHFVTSCDRGKYVRYAGEYRALLQEHFPVVDMDVGSNRDMLIPNTSVLLKARVGKIVAALAR